jgi:hypothetical protein
LFLAQFQILKNILIRHTIWIEYYRYQNELESNTTYNLSISSGCNLLFVAKKPKLTRSEYDKKNIINHNYDVSNCVLW